MAEKELTAASSPFRQYGGLTGRLVRYYAAAVALYHLLYVADFFDLFKISLFGAHRGLSYALVLSLAFLLVPAARSQRRDRLPWYDALVALAALAPTLYFFLSYDRLVAASLPTMTEQMLAGLLFAISLEAARRTLGWPLALLGLLFGLYTMTGQNLPGILHAKSFSFTRMSIYLYASTQGVFGIVMEVFATIIVTYLILASFLNASGAGEFITKLGVATVGRFRGGAAKAAVVGSGLFGTISGLAVANVVTTGTVTIPLMKKSGYEPHFAGAVEATASTGGVIMPPVMGAVAFVMAELMDIPYWTVALAALIPGVLYFLAIYWQVDFHSAKHGLSGITAAEVPPIWQTLKQGWQFIIPIAVLIFFLGVLNFSPAKSGLYAIISLIPVSFLSRNNRLTPRRVATALQEGTYGLVRIAPAAGVIGILMGAVSLTGLGIRLSGGLVDLAGGILIVLLVLAAITPYVLGMGLDVLTIYIMLAIFVAPAMAKMGVEPIAAHLFIVYFAVTSLITPPVALATYAAAAIAGSRLWNTGFQAMRLGIVAFIVPFFFVYNPVLLLKGTIPEIIQASFTSLAGVVCLAAALEGYLLRTVPWWGRTMLAGAGGLLVFPGWRTDLAGVVLAAIPVLLQIRQWTRERESTRLKALSQPAR